MKEYKTVRVGKLLEAGGKTYYGGTYVVDSDEAAAIIAAGGTEVKPPASSVARAEEVQTSTKNK